MGIFQMRLFQMGVFKQAQFLFSSPKTVQKELMASDTGVLGIEPMPLDRSCIVDRVRHMAWIVIHRLKVNVDGVDEPVLPISERSMYPISPFEKLTAEDKVALKALATARYIEEFTSVRDSKNESANLKLAKTVMWLFFIAAMIIVVVLLFKK